MEQQDLVYNEGGVLMIHIPTTARGVARPATPEEIERERLLYYLATDAGDYLLTDTGDFIVPNVPEFGYTNPNLHRRIDNEIIVEPGSDYPFVKYDAEGNAYPQTVKLGVWDGRCSYRTTTTYTHDEESTTCEIP